MKKMVFVFMFLLAINTFAGKSDALKFNQLKRFIPKRGYRCFLQDGMPEEIKASYCNTAFARYDYPDKISSIGVRQGIIEFTISDCFRLNGCSRSYLIKHFPHKKKFTFADGSHDVYYERKYGDHIEYYIPLTKRLFLNLVLFDTRYEREVRAIFRKIRLFQLKRLALSYHRDE